MKLLNRLRNGLARLKPPAPNEEVCAFCGARVSDHPEWIAKLCAKFAADASEKNPPREG
jgi:hypothetical protein